MTRVRPRTEIILKGFELALRGKRRALIHTEPLTGMSVDTVAVVIYRTETLRLHGQFKGSKRLRPAIQRAVVELGLPLGKRYAYEVVVLAYYNQIWQYVAAVRRKRAQALAVRAKHLDEAAKAA